jgi:hypothetical protein
VLQVVQRLMQLGACIRGRRGEDDCENTAHGRNRGGCREFGGSRAEMWWNTITFSLLHQHLTFSTFIEVKKAGQGFLSERVFLAMGNTKSNIKIILRSSLGREYVDRANALVGLTSEVNRSCDAGLRAQGGAVWWVSARCVTSTAASWARRWR